VTRHLSKVVHARFLPASWERFVAKANGEGKTALQRLRELVDQDIAS